MMSKVVHFSCLQERTRYDWDTDCWNWQMSKVCVGYGRMSFRGRLCLAHRVSKLLFGEMTEEQFNDPSVVVMHTCDNPSCINPTHLQIGTQRDNIADRSRKGRTARHLNRRDAQGRFR